VAAEFDAGPLGASFERLAAVGLLERAQVGDAASLASDRGDLRLWTHRHGSDGFYAAAWERRAA